MIKILFKNKKDFKNNIRKIFILHKFKIHFIFE